MSSSSSAARLLIRDGKSAASLLFRSRTANLTETVQKSGSSAIRSLLRFNQTPVYQYPVYSEILPVMQSGFRVGLFREETMEADHGKQVGDDEDSYSEEETDSDDEDFDDIDMDDDDDEEFDDSDDDDNKEDEKHTIKEKK
ncbi:unnamed protein product [Cochlearia groenlandica]